MSWFGLGRRPTAAERLKAGTWRCRSCEQDHSWPFDLAAFAPDPWRGNQAYEPNSALRMDGDFLSEDFCVLDGRYFMVRCVLMIPVRGMAEFGFGCWSTLSKINFERYVADFDTGTYPDDARWTGWLCNRLEEFVGDDPIGVWVQPRSGR